MVRFVGRSAVWAVPLGVAWWALAEGRPGSWGVGVPTVAAAALVAAALLPLPRSGPRPGPLLRLAGWFAVESIRGGADVARRALAPSLPIDPGLLELRTTLPGGAARVLLADAVSLMPGTVAVDLDGDRMVLHALDVAGAERGFREAEARVAAAFAPAAGGRA